MLIGIVGKPSSGKSTFFKAATLIDVAIASYPFTTIKPNFGTGFVRVECVDKEFKTQCNPKYGYCINHIRFVPVELIDVAGLVPGAHEGKGLGNQFLNDLSAAHVLIHVIDLSGSINEKGEAVTPFSYDPANDIRFLEHEIDMWFTGILKRGWDKFARQMQQNTTTIEKALATQLSSFRVTEALVKSTIEKLNLGNEPPTKWTDEQLKSLATEFRKATKPIVIACNKADVPGSEKNFERLKKEFPEYMLVPCSSESEVALKEAAKKKMIDYAPGDKKFEIIEPDKLNANQKKALEFIEKNVLGKWGSTGVQECLDKAVFEFLKYIAIFPAGVNKLADKDGNILPDCHLMPPGSTALDFAYKIHTDFGKNFLYAMDAKTKMKIGGDKKLKNRDAIEIISAAR